MKRLGSIEKRTNGFRLTFSFGKDPVGGKYRKLRVTGFKTEPQAEIALTTLNAALTEGVPGAKPGPDAFAKVLKDNGWPWKGDLPGVNSDVVTVTGMVTGFLDYRLENGFGTYAPLAERSHYDKMNKVKNHLNGLGDRDITTVSEMELIDYRDKLSKSSSPRTAKEMLNILRPAFEWAVRHRGLLAASPAANLGGNVFGEGDDDVELNAYGIFDAAGRLKKEPPKILLKEEYEAALEWLKEFDIMWYVFSLLMLASGARLGEIAALRVSSCVLDVLQPVIVIRGSVTRGKTGLRVGKGKNSGSGRVVTRTVPINRMAAAALKTYLASETWKKRARSSNDMGPDAIVFRTRNGELLSNSSWKKPFLQALLDGAQLTEKAIAKRRLTPYSWRHTHITELVMLGKPLLKIAKRVGNSPRMIEKHYFHTHEDEMADLAI